MTREQAIAAAQQRNIAEHARTGALESVWVEVELPGGGWDIALCERVRTPWWRRSGRFMFEFLLESDPAQAGFLPEGRSHRWRLRRPRRGGPVS